MDDFRGWEHSFRKHASSCSAQDGLQLFDMSSIVLHTSSLRAAVSRAVWELQLSLGSLPTMGHPLAKNLQTRELHKV